MNRRDFLSRAAAGSAVLTMPAWLAGCGVQPAKVVAEPVPDNPFLDWFGIDQTTIRQVMSALTGRGADFADLYFQHARTSSLLYEGGVVSNAESKTEQGVGLRVVTGDQTGFASTEDLSGESMLAAASTASGSASGHVVTSPRTFRSAEPGDLLHGCRALVGRRYRAEDTTFRVRGAEGEEPRAGRRESRSAVAGF